ncbi:ABC transporter substrate-binding protein [Oceanobacillus jeddahense]|uniref:ABC transporter substrate-binding protein n=1 Tax=Oceanobacillus jeddahense TaxID=1462527 RepID=UPI000596212A|nr:extracellular solute-binding protein [Oceanobacillus jeddahense]
MKKIKFHGLLILFIILSLVMAGCSSDDESEAGENGTITYFSPETLGMLEDLAVAYEEEYEGANINVEYGGANDIINQLIAESGNPSGDLWYGAGGFIPFETAKDRDLLEPYTPERAEDWEVDEGGIKMRDEDWHWVAMNFRVLGFAYNTDLVSEEEAPKTWDDLLDPRWEGKMQMANPSASGTSTLIVLSQLLRLGEEEGWEYLDQLVGQMSTMPDAGVAPATAVSSGEAEIAIVFDYHAYTQQGEGESIDFIVPDETPVLANPAAVIKDAPNEVGGGEFMNFLLSDKAQQIFADNYMLTISDNVETSTPLTLENVMPHAQDMDIDWILDNYDEARSEWQNRY